MKTELRIIIALLVLIVLYLYVPAILTFSYFATSDVGTVIALIGFGAFVAFHIYTKIKGPNRG